MMNDEMNPETPVTPDESTETAPPEAAPEEAPAENV